MANTDAPRGFWPIYHLTGGQIRVREYEVVNTNANLLTKGDVAKILTTGYADLAAADIAADAIGIFSHFEYKDAAGKFYASTQVPATKTGYSDIKAFVWDDPYIAFGCQSNGTTTIASVGACANHVATAADTTRKISQHEWDQSSIVVDGNSAQFKLLDKIDEPDNAWGANVNLIVTFNEHHYKAAGVAV
jgi:hypothetical protein